MFIRREKGLSLLRIVVLICCFQGSFAFGVSVFENRTQALVSWFGTYDIGELPHYFYGSYQSLGVTIALDRMLAQNDPEWIAEEVLNYAMFDDNSWPKFTLDVPYSQKPWLSKQMTVYSWYYIRSSSNPQDRLLAALYGGGLYVVYKDEQSLPIAEAFTRSLDDQLKNNSVYKGQVLEFDGYSVSFLPDVENTNVNWEQFIFPSTEKAALVRAIDGFLNLYDRDEWKRLGLPLSRGILLHGPPGTGKSFIGKVLISNVLNSFYSQAITYIHVSARHTTSVNSIRQLYQVARDFSPSVIFFEDIDLIAGTSRGHRSDVKNELMQQLSGLEGLEGVLTIGTTNFGEKIDPALKRSKRLGYHFSIGLPTYQQRLSLFEVYARGNGRDLDFSSYADRIEGWSGADIKEMVEMAKEYAVKQGSTEADKVVLTESHLNYALGMKTSYRLTEWR